MQSYAKFKFFEKYTLKSFSCSTIIIIKLGLVPFRIYTLFTFLISRSPNNTQFLIFRDINTINLTTLQWQLNHFEGKTQSSLLLNHHYYLGIYNLASSALIFIVHFFTTCGKSFTYKRNSEGQEQILEAYHLSML